MTTQETQSDLEKAFQKIRLEEISVLPDGRIEIKNPKIAETVERFKAQAQQVAANDQCANTRCTDGTNPKCTNTECK